MRKLIETYRKYLIECDFCDYKIPNLDGGDGIDCKDYINKPCPICGNNLLTESDYKLDKSITDKINFINKYFSWITIFFFKKDEKETNISVKVHDGIKIKKTND